MFFSAIIAKLGLAAASIWGKVVIGVAIFALVASVVLTYNQALVRNTQLQNKVQSLETVIKNRDAQIIYLQDNQNTVAKVISEQNTELTAQDQQIKALEDKLKTVGGGSDAAPDYLQQVINGIREINK